MKNTEYEEIYTDGEIIDIIISERLLKKILARYTPKY